MAWAHKNVLLFVCLGLMVYWVAGVADDGGNCFTTDPEYPPDPDLGQNRTFCHLKGVFFSDGTSFITHDCYRCQCDDAQLKCCGYGYKSGRVIYPDECEELHEGCERRFVMKEDHSLPCDWSLLYRFL